MAIIDKSKLANPIQDKKTDGVEYPTEWETPWNGHTGEEVESFITEKLKQTSDNSITGIRMEGQTLYLDRGEGVDPLQTEVIIAEAEYNFKVLAYGLVINRDFNNIKKDLSELVTQYSAGTTFHLGVVMQGTATVVSNVTDINQALPVTISYGGNSIDANVVPTKSSKLEINNSGDIIGIKVDDIENEIAWIDVTPLFMEPASDALEVSYEFDYQNKVFEGSSILSIGTIINEVVILSYNGEIVTNSNSITFSVSSNNNYKLEGFVVKNNGTAEEIKNVTGLSYDNMVPGLNQFIVRAVNEANPLVVSDYITADIIYTRDVTGAIVAINKVNNTIANNGVATLYNLTVYSPTGSDEAEINTYVADQLYSNISQIPESSLVQRNVLTDTSYTENEGTTFETEYQKYMEITGGGNQYLYVNSNNGSYKFLSVVQVSGEPRCYQSIGKSMTVEPLDTSLTFYGTGATMSFDQIKGCLNEIFKTSEYYKESANINPELETSDGWVSEEGRNIFRVSAQNQPVFKSPLNLNVGDSFTIELGFKTYNVSNEHAAIMTFGNLELRSNQLCWSVNKSAAEENVDDTFTARNSQFQSGVEKHVLITIKGGAGIKDEGIYYPDYLDVAAGSSENLAKLDAYKINLVRIFVDGVIDREFILTNEELTKLKQSVLQINPTGCDIDFYLLRIYSTTALNFEQVKRNYISFLKLKNDKIKFYNRNDIVGQNGEISFAKARKQYNTLVYVFPRGYKKTQSGSTNDTGRFPNRAWGYANNDPAQDNVMKKAHVTLFVNYINESDNLKYGGRITKGQVKGQGSSAMRYLIWNVSYQLNKFKDSDGKKIKSAFTPYKYLNTRTNRFEVPSGTKLASKYIMPKYVGEADTADYEAQKLVGKVNFASSMQSHKQGACKLYDDAFKKANNSMPATGGPGDYGSKKAVHEEAFLYFYYEADLDNDGVDSIELSDILSAGDKVKFMGFQTWGPAKKDKAYFGYSDNTPEYILIEGGENNDQAAQFRVPWHALQRANQDIESLKTNIELGQTYAMAEYPTCEYNPEKSWERLFISDESIVYDGSTGALDVDFGLEGDAAWANKEETITYWAIDPNCRNSINKFRAFYDFVYSHDYNFEVDDNANPSTSNWTYFDGTKDVANTGRKYVVTATKFEGFPNHKPLDIYRYESYQGKWVPAGLSYNFTTNQWNSLNLGDVSGLGQLVSEVEAHREQIKEIFKNEIGNYVNINDVAFHQAFVKFLSGTDNRAKNTYFQMVGPLYVDETYTEETAAAYNAEHSAEIAEDESKAVKAGDPTGNLIPSNLDDNPYQVRLMGDDLDTIIRTDNNGLQTKPYNLLEPAYNEAHRTYWGDNGNNIFFYMFDEVFGNVEIKKQLANIISVAFQDANVSNPTNYFYSTFFDIQDNQYPAVAYNHTAKIYYENAQYIYDTGIIGNYNNNNVRVPLSQSHGSSSSCEKDFMQKRYNFLATYVQNVSSDLGEYDFAASTGGAGVVGAKVVLEFEPYQDFYPTYYWNRTSNIYYLGEFNPESPYDAKKYLAEVGKTYVATINQEQTGTNNALQSTSLYKTFKLTGSLNPVLNPSLDHVTNITVDNAEKDKYPLFNNWPDSALNSTGSIAMSAPVLETLALRNMELGSEINLTNYIKLKTIDFTGSRGVKYVILPQTGRLETVILPSSVDTLRIYKNPGLKATINNAESNTYQGVIYDITKLKTVYINANQCGEFNITDLCEKLETSQISNLTLRNVNISITENALIALMKVSTLTLTGKIKIVDESGELAPISFSTLQAAVNKFGNIKDNNNPVVINFKLEPIENIKLPSNISLYGSEGNTTVVTPVIESGNNINIKVIDGVARLDITYNLYTSSTGTSTLSNKIATIDPITGVITLKAESSTPGYVSVSIKTTNGTVTTNGSQRCLISFVWAAPKVGDFAYSDGSFSASYLPNKTMIGMVYAVNAKSESEGTAYIIGKEYAYDKGLYSGYSGETGEKTNNTYQATAYYLKYYVEQELKLNNYSTITGINTNQIRVDDLTKTTYEESNAYGDDSSVYDHFTGKQDTLAYVNHVNKRCLGALRTKYTRLYDYITKPENSEDYVISNKNAFNQIYNYLEKNINAGETESDYDSYESFVQSSIATSVIFPYFYSMYLYQPQAEDLIDEYREHNWYVPSLEQLQRVIYYRGLSSQATFENSNFVRKAIDGSVTGQFSIFSSAYNKITAQGGIFPIVWDQLVGTGANVSEAGTSNGNNLTTTLNTTSHNNYVYAYSTRDAYSTNSWSYDTVYENKWVSGTLPAYIDSWNNTKDVQYSSYPGSLHAWSLYSEKHYGIPFVEYNYKKA